MICEYPFFKLTNSAIFILSSITVYDIVSMRLIKSIKCKYIIVLAAQILQSRSHVGSEVKNIKINNNNNKKITSNHITNSVILSVKPSNDELSIKELLNKS